jgi:LysM repeat protein
MQKILLLALVFGLAACQPAPTFVNPAWPTPTEVTGQPHIFFTATAPALTPTSAARPSPVFTHTPLPSPTPFIYVVKRGDSMLGIALFYGIELTALKIANPTVDPMLMSVGTQLIIPLAGLDTLAAEPTATPVLLTIQAPVCFPENDGSLWCGLVMKNESGQAVENISVLLDLVGPDGGLLASRVIFPPLNRLSTGGSLGLAGQFEGLADARVQAYARLLTAAPVGSEADRYLAAQAAEEQVTIAASLRQARFAGVAQVTGRAQVLWVVAFGYDDQDNLVGLRKLVFEGFCPPEGEAAPPQPCPPVVFDSFLYSAGPEIARVDVQMEARP